MSLFSFWRNTKTQWAHRFMCLHCALVCVLWCHQAEGSDSQSEGGTFYSFYSRVCVGGAGLTTFILNIYGKNTLSSECVCVAYIADYKHTWFTLHWVEFCLDFFFFFVLCWFNHTKSILTVNNSRETSSCLWVCFIHRSVLHIGPIMLKDPLWVRHNIRYLI